MRNIFFGIYCITIQCAAFLTGNAQVIELKPAPPHIAIDGSLTEWGDQLAFADKKNTFSYLISKDHNNLYLIVKTKDTVSQGNILGSGITFTVGTSNSKLSQMVTYPLRGKEDPSEYMELDREQVVMKTILARYKRISVQNFKHIKAEQLSTANPYGIKVALGFTDDGAMIYEEAIPLTLLPLERVNDRFSYSIRVNGLARKVFFLARYEAGGQVFDNYILPGIRDSFRIGPMPTSDYDEKLTADTEARGEFIIGE